METRFEELKRYVAFDDADAALLRAFGSIAAPHFARLADEFYDRIREHEYAHAVFKDEDQIARLRVSLQKWMARLLSGSYDTAYLKETQKIGRVHVKVGLPERYVFTAMALIRVGLTRIATAELEGDLATKTCEALTRMLDLELSIMVESYRDNSLARVQRIERIEKEELGRTLLRSERRYVNAVELSRSLIIGIDAGGEIRLFNREAERVTGYSRDEILKKRFVETLIQEDLVETRGAEILRTARGEQGGRDTIDCAIRTRAGKYRDVRWQLAYTPLDVDDEVSLFLIGYDRTEELAFEERTRQTEKLASIGTLAAGLAHEIRNPLNGARLHVSFLSRKIAGGTADDEARDALQIVDDEIGRLAALVTEFLNFARPQPPDLRPTSARALVERASQLVAHTARDVNVDLVMDLPTRDPALLVDPAKIEQVLLNLLTNATEALAPRGGGRVVVRVRRMPRSVRFEVEDDGPGLVDPNHPIFDPFFSTKPQGTGLGLTISHRIVTDHRGLLDVESRPGKTVFRMTLPMDAE